MGGGSGGGGTSTTTSKQGLPKWELPYAQGLTGQAQGLYTGSGYPQQQTAAFTPDQLAAMQGVEGMTGQQQGISDITQLSNLGLATGQNPYIQQGMGDLGSIAGGQNQALNTAQGALGSIATGQNPYMQQAYGANQGLLNNPYVNQAQQANAAIAGGANLNAATNPGLQSYLNAGMLPMIQNYEQAVAPNILQNAVASGGLGSSGTEQAFQNAQSALAQGLGTYTSGVIEPAYQAALGQQEQAIANTTGLLSPYEQGISNLSGLAGQQAGAASALPGTVTPQISAASQIPAMLAPQQSAIAQSPGLQTAAYGPTGQLQQVGTQQQQQAQNVLNNLFGNQMMPYQMLTQAANLVGPISGGGGQSFTVQQGPGGTAK